jgi:hypothetical protein
LEGEGNQGGWIERVGGRFPKLLALDLGATIEKERASAKVFSFKYFIVQLGPSLSPGPRAGFGPKWNTKIGLHTHPPTHPPPPTTQTFYPVAGGRGR